MADRPLYAPGCFGFSVYSEDAVCGACPYAGACAPLAQRKLTQLRDHYGFQTKPTRQVGELPVKVKKIFEELGKSADEVRIAMQSGVNPYTLRAGFIGIACQVVLKRKSTTREFIAAVMVAHRKYNEATADVYARHAIQILKHCGVITTDGNKVELISGLHA